MKHRGLKFLSLLLTLVLLVGLLPGMSLTAYAAETSETIYLTYDDEEMMGPTEVTGIHFKVKSGKEMNYAGLKIDQWSTMNVSSIDETTITKVVWSYPDPADGSNANQLTVSPGSFDGNNTVTGINSSNLTVSTTSTGGVRISSITIYYEASDVTYTVTYAPGDGSGSMNPTKVEKNAEGKYMYKAESCGFTAPEGKTFDFWKGSDDKEYRVGGEYELTGDLTLTAQWKEEKKPDGGEKKTGGSGGGFDLVFNIPGADNSWEYVGGYVAPQQAYRVSLAPMQGGSAPLGLTTGDSGTQMNVYPSTTVYVFPNAEQGYTLDKIVWSLIDGSASYDITEAKNFVMPAMDVVVYVTFKPVG